MKKILPYTALLLVSIVLFTCKKQQTNPAEPSSSLIGSKWAVVNSLQVAGNLLGGNRPPTTSNYVGKPGDYFTFNANGNLYFHINDQSDTAGTSYKISGDTVLCVSYFYEGTSAVLDSNLYAVYIISNLTNKTCTLYSYIEGPDIPIATTLNLNK